jgi:hypothetical protein
MGALPYIIGHLINDAIKNITEHERQLAFYNGGIKSIIQNEDELFSVVRAISLFNFSREQDYIADMYTGIYSMLTRGEKFIETHPVYGVYPDTGEKYLSTYRIITTIPTLYKAALGRVHTNKM